MTRDVFLCDGIRTPIGRYAGALAKVRTDDLAALPIKALMARNDEADWAQLDEVFYGCANQAGEDNRNVARMAVLLSGLPRDVPGTTLNRLCASGLDAVGAAARAIRAGEIDFAIAGGVESMTRAPFVMGKSQEAFGRQAEIHDTTIGWRFVNKAMKERYGTDSMPETGENVAQDFQVSRADQDAFALRSQQRAAKAQADGFFAGEIVPVDAPGGRGGPIVVDKDEHPRADTTAETLAKLKPIVRADGTVTAGNASGVNDGSAALILASTDAVRKHGLHARARCWAWPAPASTRASWASGRCRRFRSSRHGWASRSSDFDAIELNEAFASQAVAVLRGLGIAEDADIVNPNGGAIALGHPLGMSGARLALTLSRRLEKGDAKLGLATLCVGVGQGVALALARI